MSGHGMRWRRLRPVVVIGFLAAGPLGAQEGSTQSGSSAYRRRVLGVFNEQTGRPIEGADVLDVLTGNVVRTSSTGSVSLAFLPEGASLVRVRKLGYTPLTVAVSITPSDSLPISLILTPVVELPTVVTTDSAPHYTSPVLRAFEQRRRTRAAGYFISEHDLRRNDGRSLGDVLKTRAPGIHVVQGRAGALLLRRSMRCSAGADPDVYLDGVLLAQPKPVDLSQFKLTTLAGVEYYATTGTAPAEFGRTSRACGTLLLWSWQH